MVITMKQLRSKTAIAVAALGVVALIVAPVLAGGTHGSAGEVQPAHMGQGYGQGFGMTLGSGMGPGMMMGPGSGMGSGMMGSAEGGAPCAGIAPDADRDLDADDVRASLERSLDWHGNKRLKVGEVTETDDDTVVAEIVTVDGSLVQRLEVDRHTGRMQQVN